MNIEDLTKTQLLLLTLLVNFVTSIATGVLTVSLLNQAPATVIQTVNRIVDHTIETVTNEVPVIRNVPGGVPSTEDLLTNAIAKNKAHTVRLYRAGVEEALSAGFYSASARAVYTTVTGLPGTVTIEFSDGTRVEARSMGDGASVTRYDFDAGTTLPSASESALITAADVKQGQTALALSSQGAAVTGIVTLVTTDRITTNLPGIPTGTPVMNLSGDVIGLSLEGGVLLPADRMSAAPAP